MPARSKNQFRLIQAKRSQYKSEANTPDEWKWVWEEKWTDVNFKKLPKKVKENIITKFEDFVNEKKNEIKTIPIEKIALRYNIDLEQIKKNLEVGISYEREHIDNSQDAEKIVLKNLEQNPLYYQENHSKIEYDERVNKLEKEKRKKKEQSETSTNIQNT